MGVQKLDGRPVMALGGLDQVGPVNSYGSTSGTVASYGTVLITATATGLVYTLPAPKAGTELWVSVDYNGATGSLTLANASTTTVFNGSTANIITVSSSEAHLNVYLRGGSTSRWNALTSTGAGVAFAGSTVTG